VGAPHRRQRVFLLAYRDGATRGHQPGRECGPRGAGAPESGDAGKALAHGHGLALERSGSVFDGQRAPCRDDADGCNADVADASGEGLQGCEWPGTPREGARAPRPASECGGHTWPPGPDDADGWRDYLAAGGPAPAVSRLRGGADGVAEAVESSVWADRLRLLGNGVVPAQAAAAYQFLATRLGVGL
jgi:DNA (cytosine-5)-methyltransferase 1